MIARTGSRALVGACLVALMVAATALAPVGSPATESAVAFDVGDVAPPDWRPCGGPLEGFDCASYPVPVDHADPFGPQMELTLLRLPATGDPDERIGSLFLNPGGPGGSALDFLFGYAAKFSPEVRAQFDIVALNPRGVNGSSPALDCGAVSPLAPPDDWAAFFAAREEANGAASTACQLSIARTGPYYGTNQVVEDLDLLRAAVGDERLNYWGISYGSRIGEVYAQRHPSRIRAMILDGSVDPHNTSLSFNVPRAASFDGAFDFFLGAYPEIVPAYEQVVAALAQAPMEVLDQHGAPTTLTTDSFYTQAIMGLLPSEQLWPVMAGTILSLADQLDGGPLATVTLVAGTPNMATVGVQVNCLDLPQRPSVAEMTVAAEEMVAAGPTFGPYVAITLPICNGFAIPADPIPANSPSASALPPVLIFGSVHDPATPYQWSVAMRSFLPGSVRTTYEGAQHGVWNGPSDCIDAIGDAYFLDLELPAPDVSCPFVSPSGP